MRRPAFALTWPFTKALTVRMVRAVDGHAHIHSTADAVYAETPAENYVAFVRTAREESERRGETARDRPH